MVPLCNDNYPSVEGARAALHRVLHGHPRLGDRGGRAAVDQRRPALRRETAAVSAYLLSPGGRAADLLGPRRRVLMFGTGLFALAWRAVLLPGLIAAPVSVQGTAAAIMTPTALSIVTTTFAEGAECNKALGVWAAIGGIVGATAAWLVGGPITEGLGWSGSSSSTSRLLLVLYPALLNESRDREHGRRLPAP